MHTGKTIFGILLSCLLGASSVFACEGHEPVPELDLPMVLEVEEAFIEVHNRDANEDAINTGTLRILLNPDHLYNDLAGIEVRLSNDVFIGAEIRSSLDVPNSGELVVDVEGAFDFFVGTWQVDIIAIGLDVRSMTVTASVEVRAMEEPSVVMSSGCDIGSQGSTTWSSLMCVVLFGFMGLRRRRA